MPGTFTLDLVTINNSDTTTGIVTSGWTTAIGAVDDYRIEGNFALAGRASNATAFVGAALSGSTNRGTSFTGSRSDDHVFIWANNFVPNATDLIVSGGITVWVSSGNQTFSLTGTTPNNGDATSRNWNVSGRDKSLTGGFECYVVNPFNSGSFDVGVLDRGNIGLIGIRQKTISAIANGNLSFVVDAIRVGTGITITSGTVASPVTFEDLYITGSNTGSATSAAPSGAWGFVTKQGSTYYLAAKFNIGSITQTTFTNFVDSDASIVWKGFPVSSSFYSFNITGSTNTGSLMRLGAYSAGLSTNGCTISAPSGTVWNLIVGPQSSSFQAYGSTLSRMRYGTIYSGSELRDTFITNGGTLISSGALIDNCQFIANKAILGSASLAVPNSASVDGKLTNTSFIGNFIGLQLATAMTYSFSNLQFSNNTFDVWNSSGGPVRINASNGANPSTVYNSAGGTTQIVNTIILSLTGIISGSEVRIYTAGTTTEVAGIESIDNPGTFQYSYTYVAGSYVDIVIHNIWYQYYRINSYLLGSTAASLPIQQVFDRNYSNPP